MEVWFSVTTPDGKVLEMRDEFEVDTGFTGDLKVPQSVGIRLKGMGLAGYARKVLIPAGKTKYVVFDGMITRITLDGTDILKGPQACSIMCVGPDDTPRLVGLNALKHWRICVDVPQKVLSMEQDP